MMSPATQPSSAPPPQTSIAEALQQRHQDRAAGNDQRHAGGKAEDDQRRLDARGMREVDPRRRDLGRGRDRDDVVEAHDDVGDGDDAHRAPEIARALTPALVAVGVLGDDSLIATQNSSRPPTSLRYG